MSDMVSKEPGVRAWTPSPAPVTPEHSVDLQFRPPAPVYVAVPTFAIDDEAADEPPNFFDDFSATGVMVGCCTYTATKAHLICISAYIVLPFRTYQSVPGWAQLVPVIGFQIILSLTNAPLLYC